MLIELFFRDEARHCDVIMSATRRADVATLSGCYVGPTCCRRQGTLEFKTADVDQSWSSRRRAMICSNMHC